MMDVDMFVVERVIVGCFVLFLFCKRYIDLGDVEFGC